MSGKLFRGLAFTALLALVFMTSCQAWWVGGDAPSVERPAE